MNLSILIHMYINIYSFIISIIILINEFHGVERRILQDKLFKAILCLNMVLIAFDSIGWVSNLHLGPMNNSVNTIITTINYIITPLPLILWCIYTNYQVFQNKKRIRKIIFTLSFPMIINALSVVISPFTGLVFYFDNKNIYHRGPFFIILAATCYFYIFYSFIFVILNKKRIESYKFLPMLMFPIPILIGGILQNDFLGLSTIWSGSTISILILFFSIQDSRLGTDYLTGLYNRRQLDNYLNGKTNNSYIENLFAGIMIDVDKFKLINDLYGHQIGDEALVAVSKLLKKCFPKNDFIARYAGDEFVVILDIKKPKELNTSIERLKDILKSFNSKSIKPYELSLSVGYAVYDNKSGMTSDYFIKKLDSLMYRDKKSKN
jgi:diguanylate cyclase (GGDEF)-like protein